MNNLMITDAFATVAMKKVYFVNEKCKNAVELMRKNNWIWVDVEAEDGIPSVDELYDGLLRLFHFGKRSLMEANYDMLSSCNGVYIVNGGRFKICFLFDLERNEIYDLKVSFETIEF